MCDHALFTVTPHTSDSQFQREPCHVPREIRKHGVTLYRVTARQGRPALERPARARKFKHVSLHLE